MAFCVVARSILYSSGILSEWLIVNAAICWNDGVEQNEGIRSF